MNHLGFSYAVSAHIHRGNGAFSSKHEQLLFNFNNLIVVTGAYSAEWRQAGRDLCCLS